MGQEAFEGHGQVIVCKVVEDAADEAADEEAADSVGRASASGGEVVENREASL